MRVERCWCDETGGEHVVWLEILKRMHHGTTKGGA